MGILLVEDDQDLADIVSYALRRAGYDLVTTFDGFTALRLIKDRAPTLVILDISLPRIDGWQVLQQLRANSNIPVIMLTARGDDADIVRGLRMGADDYVTKPFSPTQLVARVESVLRRSAQDPSVARARVLELGPITLDLNLHRASLHGRVVHLTRTEFRLLYELALHEGEVVTHQELARRVWGYRDSERGSITKSHVRNLRRKIEQDPSAPAFIRTFAGLGYGLQVRRESQPVERRHEVATNGTTSRYDAPHANTRRARPAAGTAPAAGGL